MKRSTPNERRAAFGRLLARRVADRQMTRESADIVLEDFANALSDTDRGSRIVLRTARRAYQRAVRNVRSGA